MFQLAIGNRLDFDDGRFVVDQVFDRSVCLRSIDDDHLRFVETHVIADLVFRGEALRTTSPRRGRLDVREFSAKQLQVVVRRMAYVRMVHVARLRGHPISDRLLKFVARKVHRSERQRQDRTGSDIPSRRSGMVDRPPSAATIRRWCAQFAQSGHEPAALLPRR